MYFPRKVLLRPKQKITTKRIVFFLIEGMFNLYFKHILFQINKNEHNTYRYIYIDSDVFCLLYSHCRTNQKYYLANLDQFDQKK